MANLTCFNVSSRTACGTRHWKFTCFPQQHQSTHIKGSCHHLWSEKFILDDKWRGEASPVQGDECHFYVAASISGIHVLSYVTPIFQFLAHLNCTFHLKASRWLSPTSSCDLGLSRAPGRITTCTSRVDEISNDFDTVKMVLPSVVDDAKWRYRPGSQTCSLKRMWTWQVHLTTRSCSNFNAGTFFFRSFEHSNCAVLCSRPLPLISRPNLLQVQHQEALERAREGYFCEQIVASHVPRCK